MRIGILIRGGVFCHLGNSSRVAVASSNTSCCCWRAALLEIVRIVEMGAVRERIDRAQEAQMNDGRIEVIVRNVVMCSMADVLRRSRSLSTRSPDEAVGIILYGGR
jgi:hypothetical protein